MKLSNKSNVIQAIVFVLFFVLLIYGAYVINNGVENYPPSQNKPFNGLISY